MLLSFLGRCARPGSLFVLGATWLLAWIRPDRPCSGAEARGVRFDPPPLRQPAALLGWL